MEDSNNNFVESVIPLRAIKSAVEFQHSHENMGLLSSLTTSGSSIQYLGGDGQYHDFPESFYVDAFLLKYNNNGGNVTAAKDIDGNLYMQAENTFASALDNKVIGSIELERESDKQVNVSIAEVDVNSGVVSENDLKYLTVGTGARLNFENGILSLDLDQSEAPFVNMMEKQVSAVVGDIGVFDAYGSVIDVGVSLSSLATSSQLATHAEDTSLHVTSELQSTWNAKQVALTSGQLAATNSGITAEKVVQYDAYATNKQSVGGNLPNMNLVTDDNGNITTVAPFVPSTKISTVPTAVQNRVATFTSDGNVKDSGIILGEFSSNETVKEYLDNAVSSSIAGSSYQGTFTYFGTQAQVESVSTAVAGDTAIVYLGSITNLEGLLRGDYNGSTWAFADVSPAPSNGAWMETDNLLGNDPVVPGRIIVKMDGVNPPALDFRPNTTMQLDNATIGLNSAGRVSLVMKMLSSGKSVMNTIISDSIAYEFTNTGGTDTSKTIKEVIDANKAAAEPAFTKNTAFNKDFDTSSQSATSTMVIGNNDTRLTNDRPASDVYAWAKAATKPTYTYSEVGALGTDKISTVAPLSSAAASNEKVYSEKLAFDQIALKAPTNNPTFTGTVTVPAPTNPTDAARLQDVTGLSAVYDLVIKTQAEFEALIASATWLDAVSVALIGQFTLSTANNSGVRIPSTVKQIHGFNSAKITITNFKYNVNTAKGGLWYATTPTTLDYSIRDLEVSCTGSTGGNGYGFSYCNNLSNCTGTGTGYYGSYGFASCNNLSNCTGTGTGTGTGYINGNGFSYCNNLSNCTGTGRGTYGGFGFRDCNNLSNCTGTGTRTGTGSTYSYGFYNCDDLSNCTGTGTGTPIGIGFAEINYAVNCKDGGSSTGMWGGTNKNIVIDDSSAQTISGIKTFSVSPLVPTTPSGASAAVAKVYVDSLRTVYDKVIRTQAEFEALIADSTWFGAVSVAFVGQFTLSTANNSGVKIPATVKQIHGFNSAKITITNFKYDVNTAKGGLWYDTTPTTNDYSIRDLEVSCTGAIYCYGFFNCNNLSNCTGTGTSTGTYGYGFASCNNLSNCIGAGTGSENSYGFSYCNYLSNCTGTSTGLNGYGFFNCNYLSNCTGTATGTGTFSYGFYNCNNLSNCTGTGTSTGTYGYGFSNINYAVNCKDGGSSAGMWLGTNENIDLDTCRKTLVTADNSALNA